MFPIAVVLGLLARKIYSGLDLKCNNNVALYWGQNSFGGQNIQNKSLYEKPIDYYCGGDDGPDVVLVSFLHNFNTDTNKLPEINLAHHCEDFFQDEEVSYLRHCPAVGSGIKTCQSRNTTVMLSLGGAASRSGFTNSSSAVKFANTVWNMFLGGTHKYRPLGDAILDGVDLDIEGGSNLYYDVFVKEIRRLYSTDITKKYYVSSAPQCEFPDRSLQPVLNSAFIDMVFIQFYNNWCGIQNYNNIWAWNWPVWKNWSSQTSLNKNVKLFLGAPAARTAAGSGYISAENLEKIVIDLSQGNEFGGIMMWDASQSNHNLVKGKPYASHFKSFLVNNIPSKCQKRPTPSDDVSETPKPSTSASSTTLSLSSSFISKTSELSKNTSEYVSSTTPVPSKTIPESSIAPTSTSIPIESCPIEGNWCPRHGEFGCNRENIGVCMENKWMLISCPAGTMCVKSLSGVVCDQEKPTVCQ